jgi:hypothetical protein
MAVERLRVFRNEEKAAAGAARATAALRLHPIRE